MKNKWIRIIGVYSLFLGASVLLMWIVILTTGPVSEGKIEMGFHLFSELLMAILCFISGIYLVRGLPKGIKVNLIAHAMVVYSVINAAGYYGERNQGAMMLLFLILLLLSVTSLIVLINSE